MRDLPKATQIVPQSAWLHSWPCPPWSLSSVFLFQSQYLHFVLPPSSTAAHLVTSQPCCFVSLSASDLGP